MPFRRRLWPHGPIVCRQLRSDALLLGEVIHGDYWRQARAMHLTTVTQYELWKGIWSSLNDGNFFELAHALQRHAEFTRHFSPWTFVGNHDTTRIRTQLHDPRDVALALVVLLTVPGLPAIYAGDEQGAAGRKYDRAGGDDKVRRPPPSSPQELSGARLDLWRLHRDLIAMRRERPWLARGTLSVIRLENRGLTYEVRADAHRLVCQLSTEDRPVPCEQPGDLIPVAGQAAGEIGPMAGAYGRRRERG